MLEWRPMTAADVDGVAAVAQQAFPQHFEERACFEERLALHAPGCFVLQDEADSVKGYLVAYPWRRGDIPPLNALLGAIPEDADILYLHDLALATEARGRGLAGPIVERLAEQARAEGWPGIALVAVNDAAGFWARNGFAVCDSSRTAAQLASYGEGAHYMVREV